MRIWWTVAVIGSLVQAKAEDDLSRRGEVILKEIVSHPWAKDWKGATLNDIRLVKEKPDLAEPMGLPPVWFAKIKGADQKTGHLMWDSTGEGKLVEFSLDGKLQINGKESKAISGVPGLQEFPIKDEDGRLVASGCVPTAAASVVSYWIANGHPLWGGEDGRTPRDLALRLRGAMKMTLYPDTDGYSDNGMALAGAYPTDLASVLRADALKHKVKMEIGISRFSMDLLRSEVEASRPTLLSCIVRVAHKPELSWGHEVAAVGYTKIDGVELAGVLDNFYPTNYPEAIRWIRHDAFRSLILLHPKRDEKEQEDSTDDR